MLSPLFRFPFQFATKYISIPESLFSLCGTLDYGGVFAIISLSDEDMRGLLSPSVCHRDVINSLRRHVCASSYVRMTVLFCPKSYLLLLLTSTAFFAFSLYCQPCHLPIVPLPSRVGSRVLTLGFIQICSLRGWKVVMKAKKNSLALSLTTSLVLLMKPKENSIFCPCYSFPPILHLFPLSACILSFSISGASDSQTKSLSPSVLFKTA